MPVQLTLPYFLPPGLWDTDPAGAARSTPPLFDYPAVPSETLCHHAKLIGAAGEAFVDSLLMRQGLISLPVPETGTFDRLVLIDGTGLRLQIKTTTHPVDGVYSFAMRKGYQRSPLGCRAYEAADYDLAALVILPENVALFSAEKRAAHRISVRSVAAIRHAPCASLETAFLRLGIALRTPVADVTPPMSTLA